MRTEASSENPPPCSHCCARGPLALERLERDPDAPKRLVYHLPKPTAEGRLALTLTPLELLSRLAALIPPPRVHRHR